MRSKSLTRRAIFAALSFTFAGTLFSQSLENHQQSGEATPNLMASITKSDISSLSKGARECEQRDSEARRLARSRKQTPQ